MQRQEPVEVILRPGGDSAVMRVYGRAILIVCFGAVFLLLLGATWKGLGKPALQIIGVLPAEKPAPPPPPLPPKEPPRNHTPPPLTGW
jgi:hypothetical protein